ncbi:cation-transporting P-type ATPase 13A2, partial [Pancytospora epiphaga]
MEKLVKVKNLLKGGSTVTVDRPARETRLADVALGIVVRTGKKTKRGMMLTDMGLKKPVLNNLTVQSINTTLVLLVASIIVTLITMIFLSRYLNFRSNLVYSFDVLITFFSPSLHTARDLGIYYSRKELLVKHVNSSDPARIGTAGEIDIAVFDKTGTLTETDVDILCIDTLSERIEEFSRLREIEQLGISTCHYVMELENQYSGDILDMKMFMFSKSSVINSDGKRYIGLAGNNIYEPICREEGHPEAESSCVIFKSGGDKSIIHRPQIEVVKIFDFDSYLKRMSVVVKTTKGKCFLFCKGAPDSLRKILESVPEGYDERVNEYGLQGYRVITLAYRE